MEALHALSVGSCCFIRQTNRLPLSVPWMHKQSLGSLVKRVPPKPRRFTCTCTVSPSRSLHVKFYPRVVRVERDGDVSSHGAVVGAMACWAHARAEARGREGAGRCVGRAEEEEAHQVFHTC